MTLSNLITYQSTSTHVRSTSVFVSNPRGTVPVSRQSSNALTNTHPSIPLHLMKTKSSATRSKHTTLSMNSTKQFPNAVNVIRKIRRSIPRQLHMKAKGQKTKVNHRRYALTAQARRNSIFILILICIGKASCSDNDSKNHMEAPLVIQINIHTSSPDMNHVLDGLYYRQPKLFNGKAYYQNPNSIETKLEYDTKKKTWSLVDEGEIFLWFPPDFELEVLKEKDTKETVNKRNITSLCDVKPIVPAISTKKELSKYLDMNSHYENLIHLKKYAGVKHSKLKNDIKNYLEQFQEQVQKIDNMQDVESIEELLNNEKHPLYEKYARVKIQELKKIPPKIPNTDDDNSEKTPPNTPKTDDYNPFLHTSTIAVVLLIVVVVVFFCTQHTDNSNNSVSPLPIYMPSNSNVNQLSIRHVDHSMPRAPEVRQKLILNSSSTPISTGEKQSTSTSTLVSKSSSQRTNTTSAKTPPDSESMRKEPSLPKHTDEEKPAPTSPSSPSLSFSDTSNSQQTNSTSVRPPSDSENILPLQNNHDGKKQDDTRQVNPRKEKVSSRPKQKHPSPKQDPEQNITQK